ncbi:MAG TPA: methyltransferase [Myxococcota bacterium]|nr:methyltransferase [Myxococcota bacterium]
MTDAGEPSAHAERQRRFYASRLHWHLRPDVRDFYARRVIARTVSAAGIGRGARVLEVGAGFGRFTFPLLDECAAVTALDFSARTLAELERVRDERHVPPPRCRTVCCDVRDVVRALPGERFDAVVGFFFLHHVDDLGGTLDALRGMLAPGAAIAFVEPNRWNPLFLAQVICCPDMSWREESGLYRLGARRVEAEFVRNGFEDVAAYRFGFFPPQLVNRSARVRRLENRLERLAVLRPVLPFLLLSARAPSART